MEIDTEELYDALCDNPTDLIHKIINIYTTKSVVPSRLTGIIDTVLETPSDNITSNEFLLFLVLSYVTNKKTPQKHKIPFQLTNKLLCGITEFMTLTPDNKQLIQKCAEVPGLIYSIDDINSVDPTNLITLVMFLDDKHQFFKKIPQTPELLQNVGSIMEVVRSPCELVMWAFDKVTDTNIIVNLLEHYINIPEQKSPPLEYLRLLVKNWDNLKKNKQFILLILSEPHIRLVSPILNQDHVNSVQFIENIFIVDPDVISVIDKYNRFTYWMVPGLINTQSVRQNLFRNCDNKHTNYIIQELVLFASMDTNISTQDAVNEIEIYMTKFLTKYQTHTNYILCTLYNSRINKFELHNLFKLFVGSKLNWGFAETMDVFISQQGMMLPLYKKYSKVYPGSSEPVTLDYDMICSFLFLFENKIPKLRDIKIKLTLCSRFAYDQVDKIIELMGDLRDEKILENPVIPITTLRNLIYYKIGQFGLSSGLVKFLVNLRNVSSNYLDLSCDSVDDANELFKKAIRLVISSGSDLSRRVQICYNIVKYYSENNILKKRFFVEGLKSLVSTKKLNLLYPHIKLIDFLISTTYDSPYILSVNMEKVAFIFKRYVSLPNSILVKIVKMRYTDLYTEEEHEIFGYVNSIGLTLECAENHLKSFL